MLLSHTSEYALRIAAFLAVKYPTSRVSAQEVSQETDIPSHYISKILRKLVTANILISGRGKGGGFILARQPSRISFGDVLEAIDFDLQARHCVFGQKRCGSQNPCLLHFRWQAFNQSFFDWATQTSLQDIIKDVTIEDKLARFRFAMDDGDEKDC